MFTIGLIAAFLTTISFIPQVYLIYKTNDTKAISLIMFILFTIGVLCWLIYGVMREDKIIIAANTITITLSSFILLKKIFNLIQNNE